MTEAPDTSSESISPHLKERVQNFFRKGKNSLTVAEQVDLTATNSSSSPDLHNPQPKNKNQKDPEGSTGSGWRGRGGQAA